MLIAKQLQEAYEPWHDKTNKMSVRPVKTQISLDIRPVWSEFAVHSVGSSGPKVSSCRQQRLWSDWAGAQANLSLRWVHTGFVMSRLICTLTQMIFFQWQLSQYLHCKCHLVTNIYIPVVFTEKPCSKPLERNVVYILMITLSHAMSHDFKWRQNKPWLFTIWLDVGDVMTSLTLFCC